MKKKTTESAPVQKKPRKPYKVSRAVRMQRADAARKSALARRTTDKWRTAGVTESLFDFAVAKFGSVNEALRHLKRITK